MMQPGTCDHCGIVGMVKLAWDQRRYLCLDDKGCLQRASLNRRRSAASSIHGDDEVINTPISMMETVDSVLNEVVVNTNVIIQSKTSKVQIFICESCGIEWERPSTRGRPPKVCPSCR